MNPVFAFLKNIRKQPRRTRVIFFWILMIAIVPVAFYAWSVSFYQTLQQVTTAQQTPEPARTAFGPEILARFQNIAEQAGKGFLYVGHAISSSAANINPWGWLMERVRVLRGIPDIQPAVPDFSSVPLPVASQDASSTPIGSPANL